jgi:hypothetical protein
MPEMLPPTPNALASVLRDWQRVVSDYAAKPQVVAVAPGLEAYSPTRAPRQSPGSRRAGVLMGR